jgi:hypothetical protein
VTGAAEFGELGSGVDIDLLADYIGGALSGTPDEAAVATLIADDPAWRAAHRELNAGMTAVRAELGRFTPEPMPAELADRLDTLLTAPAAAPSAITEPTPIAADLAAPPVPHLAVVRGADGVGDGAHAVPDEMSSRRDRGIRARAGRRMRWATPIAIAAGVVAFVGFGLDYLAGRSGGLSDSAVTGTAGHAENQARDDSGGAPAAPAGLRTLESGTDYSPATLPDEPAMQALSAPDGGSSKTQQGPERSSAGADDPLGRLRLHAALQACLNAIEEENAAGPISAQTVDFATFNGAPAVVVRFSAQNGFWAWASGPACGTTSGDADTLGKAPVR